MDVRGIDHLVLTVENVERTVEFYTDALGATAETFDGGRQAVSFGDRKLNLHPAEDVYSPHAAVTEPGSADFCLVVDGIVEETRSRLRGRGIEVVHGPVEKVGARGRMASVYVRDPDGNLVELAHYD